MKWFNSIQYVALAVGGFCLNTAYANNLNTLQSLTDSEMSATTGQALMSLTYISPKDILNLESQRSGISNPSAGGVGFYKLGLEGTLELNANIKKLQLGCGGVNGSGACDIDIDYLSLSGISDTNTGRASSSAKLTNPFTEIAIRNPNSASTREVLGFRVSSEKAEGLLTFGLENAKDSNNNGIPSGINSLSGYMEIAPAGGKATINPLSNVCYANTGICNGLSGNMVTNTKITGRVQGATVLTRMNFESDNYRLNLTPQQQGDLYLPQQVITGQRITSAQLKASAVVSNINLTGRMVAQTALIDLDRQVAGVVNNLGVDVLINESLGLFHKADLNGTPASLSLQAKDILWPSTKSVAQRGWWLEFSNPIDIGDITPNKNVDIDLSTIKETLVQVNEFLYTTPVRCGFGLLNCLVGDTVPVGTVDLTGKPPVNMTLTDLSLKNQNFAPNCYGSLKFC